MRKLASVQTIKKIEPIEGADRIEKATIEGWTVVVPKGQFKEGDKAVYFEIDSFLPIKGVYEFLKNCHKDNPILGEGYLIKTQKLRGVVSQGLCMTLDDLGITPSTPVGMDLTNILDVKKYELPEMATTGGTTLGKLPYDVPHTDETRYQTYPEWKEEFGTNEYYISTKMDGSSHSVSLDRNGFHVCGHNYEYKDDGKCSFYNYVNKNNIREKMELYVRNMGIETLTIQGEFCGAGIQKNPIGLTEPQWYVFNVIVNGKRASMRTMIAVSDALGLKTVPIEEVDYDLPSKYPNDDALQARSDGKYINGKQKEGIVIRTCTPIESKVLDGYISMKVVNNKYLLKRG